MIAIITGTLIEARPGAAVVDCAGVGYLALMPTSSRASLPKIGEKVRLHTYLHVREDALTLFGFATAEERDVFEILIGVNGIGPKGGLAILSAYPPDALRKAVVGEDLDALTLIPGVGKKTAARMILELREKLGAGDDGGPISTAKLAGRPVLVEIRDALIELGYSTTEARKAIEALPEPNGKPERVEELLKIALKSLGSR
jgi:Holliday junction DNA helicase RuvA